MLLIDIFLTNIKKMIKKVSQNFTFPDFCRNINSAPVIMYGYTYYEQC
jgi:hypothetical protein